MPNTNEINKIFIDDSITINKVNITNLLFKDCKIISKKQYTILDKQITISESAKDFIELFQFIGEYDYFEYKADLNNPGIIFTGKDTLGNELKNISKNNLMVFVDGLKLQDTQYKIIDDNHLKIINRFPNKKLSTVIIYSSNKIFNLGNLLERSYWNFKDKTFLLPSNNYLSYMIFINGELIPHSRISRDKDKLRLNVAIRENIDIVEIYSIPNDTKNLLFAAFENKITYGPKDDYDIDVPDNYDTIIKFSKAIARLAVDDIRKGFLIKENNGIGCATVIDNEFETKEVKAIQILPFKKEKYDKKEFFLQVPEAKSILYYCAQFDLNGKLFTELLTSFQKTLLNEVYDTIKRIRNIRNISKVNSKHINALINFLGLTIDIKNMSLSEKHNLLEELNNFYNIVGTKRAYNFYNIFNNNTKIVKIEQLFTPIKDQDNGYDLIQRYVTFKTPEELGAKIIREYIYPIIDYGETDMLANQNDTLLNTPKFEGVLNNKNAPFSPNGYRNVYRLNKDGKSELIQIKMPENHFIENPKQGPNKPTIDYGLVDDEKPLDFYDYGLVNEKIKGEWVEWYKWDRPKNWYPTNHVNVSLQIPPEIDYDTFMAQFKKTFYDISSAVLYIHQMIDVYTFGDDKFWDDGQKPNFGIMTSQVVQSIDYTFSNNPNIQPPFPI